MANNSLPVIKENTFFNKIKYFFKSIFKKNITVTEASIESTVSKPSFLGELQDKTNIENAYKEDALEYIIKIIEENPEKLNELSIEKLEDISNYYTKKIDKLNYEIQKLKNPK